MSDKPILPNPNGVLAKGIDALVAARPNALPYVNSRTGRYWHPLAGWRAQMIRALGRMSAEAAAARLPLAEKQALRELSASEFDTLISDDSVAAVGQVTLTRTGAMPFGVIPSGFPFSRASNTTAQPLPLEAAEYASTKPIVVPAGAPTVHIPIVATRTGPQSNVVLDLTGLSSEIQPAQALFDPTFVVWGCEASGGAGPYADPQVRRMAQAFATGQFGPTKGAILAGTLRGVGVRNVAVIDAVDKAATVVYVADERWGSSLTLANQVVQALYDDNTGFTGFGCKLLGGGVLNEFVRASFTLVLRSATDANDTAGIEENVRKAARSYFDDRPDWFSWKLGALRAAVVRSDPRVLKCTSAALVDVGGNAVAESSVAPNRYEPYLTHYYLADSACNITFALPT